jgi:hypothetical protein
MNVGAQFIAPATGLGCQVGTMMKFHEIFQTSIPLSDQVEAQAAATPAACNPNLHSVPRGID